MHGSPLLERFALHDPKVAGYSAFCFIETSGIMSHFAEESDSAFIDIFTCSKIDIEVARIFMKEFFEAQTDHVTFLYRSIPT